MIEASLYYRNRNGYPAIRIPSRNRLEGHEEAGHVESPPSKAGQDIRFPHRMPSVASHRGMRFATYASARLERHRVQPVTTGLDSSENNVLDKHSFARDPG